MKKILLSTMLFSLSASAASQFRDVWYSPAAGTWGGTSSFDYTSIEKEEPFLSGIEKDKVTAYSQSFRYSVLDELYFTISGAYLVQDFENSGHYEGVPNPVLGARYQKLLSEENNFYFRNYLTIRPFLGESSDGNMLLGNTRINNYAGIGQTLGDWEYGVGLSATYFTKTYRDGSDLEAYFAFGVSANGQYDMSELLAINASLSYGLPTKVKNTSGAETKGKHSVDVSVGPSFQITEKLVVNGDISYGYSSAEVNGVSGFKNTHYGIGIGAGYNFN